MLAKATPATTPSPHRSHERLNAAYARNGGEFLPLLVGLAAGAAGATALTLVRRDRLDAAITAMAADSGFTTVTRRLCCLRGISTLTGFALAVEIGPRLHLGRRDIGRELSPAL
jgi:hypothetical protein